MERIESSQVLVSKEKMGKPSQNQAVDVISLFALLRRGLREAIGEDLRRTLLQDLEPILSPRILAIRTLLRKPSPHTFSPETGHGVGTLMVYPFERAVQLFSIQQ